MTSNYQEFQLEWSNFVEKYFKGSEIYFVFRDGNWNELSEFKIKMFYCTINSIRLELKHCQFELMFLSTIFSECCFLRYNITWCSRMRGNIAKIRRLCKCYKTEILICYSSQWWWITNKEKPWILPPSPRTDFSHSMWILQNGSLDTFRPQSYQRL